MSDQEQPQGQDRRPRTGGQHQEPPVPDHRHRLQTHREQRHGRRIPPPSRHQRRRHVRDGLRQSPRQDGLRLLPLRAQPLLRMVRHTDLPRGGRAQGLPHQGVQGHGSDASGHLLRGDPRVNPHKEGRGSYLRLNRNSTIPARTNT